MLAIINDIPNIGVEITLKLRVEPKKFRLIGFNAEIETKTLRSPPAKSPSSQKIKQTTKVIAIEIKELKMKEKFHINKLITN